MGVLLRCFGCEYNAVPAEWITEATPRSARAQRCDTVPGKRSLSMQNHGVTTTSIKFLPTQNHTLLIPSSQLEFTDRAGSDQEEEGSVQAPFPSTLLGGGQATCETSQRSRCIAFSHLFPPNPTSQESHPEPRTQTTSLHPSYMPDRGVCELAADPHPTNNTFS